MQPFMDIETLLAIAASPPAEASSPIDQSALITYVPSLLNVEDAADEQMSQDPDDIPLSDSGTLVEVPHARDELELTAEQPLDQTLVDQLKTQVHDEDDLDSPPSISLQATVAAEPLRPDNPGPIAVLPVDEL